MYFKWVSCPGWKCVAENVQVLNQVKRISQDLASLTPAFQLETASSWLPLFYATGVKKKNLQGDIQILYEQLGISGQCLNVNAAEP